MGPGMERSKLKTADYLFEEERYSEAERIYQEIYDQGQNIRALFGLVLCAYQREDYAQSLNYIDALLTLDPNHAGAFNQAGVIAYAMEDWESAKTLFQAAIERAPESVTSRRNFAEVLLKLGDYEGGLMVFMNILETNPDDTATMLRLALLNAEVERKEDAMAWAKRVLLFDPENKEVKKFLEEG